MTTLILYGAGCGDINRQTAIYYCFTRVLKNMLFFFMIVCLNMIVRLLSHLFFVGVGKSSLLLRFADNTFSGV